MEKPPTRTLLPEGYWMPNEGYLWRVLPVEAFKDLPKEVFVGDIVLTKKSEFHATVINAGGVARDVTHDVSRQREIGIEIQKTLSAYVMNNPIDLESFMDDIRLAVTDERTSIAGRCTLSNIEGFFQELSAMYGKEIPVQAAHVSLYTRSSGAVGIDTTEQMESYAKLDLPQVQEVLNTIHT